MQSPLIKYIMALAIGVSFGLLYGWVIDPVQFVDTTPDTLRADYRADYVLMTAEIYRSDGNISLAAQRLAILGSEPPAEIAAQGYKSALELKFADADIALMQRLMSSLQAGGTQ